MIRIEFDGRKDSYGKARLAEVCFQCSVCSLHCVVQFLEGYDSRHTYVYDLFQSPRPEAHRALWTCSGCHKCHLACPQDVNPIEVILSLRERAFEEGCAPPYVYDLVETVLNTGMSFPVTKKTVKDRENLGLPALKPAGDDMEKIFRLTGLAEKLAKRKT